MRIECVLGPYNGELQQLAVEQVGCLTCQTSGIAFCVGIDGRLTTFVSCNGRNPHQKLILHAAGVSGFFYARLVSKKRE